MLVVDTIVKPKTKDTNYCNYYRILSHPINDRFILEDKIQTLVEAGYFT